MERFYPHRPRLTAPLALLFPPNPTPFKINAHTHEGLHAWPESHQVLEPSSSHPSSYHVRVRVPISLTKKALNTTGRRATRMGIGRSKTCPTGRSRSYSMFLLYAMCVDYKNGRAKTTNTLLSSTAWLVSGTCLKKESAQPEPDARALLGIWVRRSHPTTLFREKSDHDVEASSRSDISLGTLSHSESNTSQPTRITAQRDSNKTHAHIPWYSLDGDNG